MKCVLSPWQNLTDACFGVHFSQIAIANPNKEVHFTLTKSGLTDRVDKEWCFVRVHDAIQVLPSTCPELEWGDSHKGGRTATATAQYATKLTAESMEARPRRL